jgi:hypothetical protein
VAHSSPTKIGSEDEKFALRAIRVLRLSLMLFIYMENFLWFVSIVTVKLDKIIIIFSLSMQKKINNEEIVKFYEPEKIVKILKKCKKVKIKMFFFHHFQIEIQNPQTNPNQSIIYCLYHMEFKIYSTQPQQEIFLAFISRNYTHFFSYTISI